MLNGFLWDVAAGCASAEGWLVTRAELACYLDYFMALAMTWKINFTSNADKVL